MLSKIYCLNHLAYLKKIGFLSKQLYIQWMSLHKIHRIICYEQEFDEILWAQRCRNKLPKK